MKIWLTKEEKIELLKAIHSGTLNTLKIPRLCDQIQGSNAFLELMMLCDAEDEQSKRMDAFQ